MSFSSYKVMETSPSSKQIHLSICLTIVLCIQYKCSTYEYIYIYICVSISTFLYLLYFYIYLYVFNIYIYTDTYMILCQSEFRINSQSLQFWVWDHLIIVWILGCREMNDAALLCCCLSKKIQNRLLDNTPPKKNMEAFPL